MQLKCLEYFKKIAEVKSISKVASSCHISQSALSQQMQKLEEDLGFKLMQRSNKGVQLTEDGFLVLKYTDNILRTFSKMMDELENSRNNREVIKIEADRTIATYCLPCALYKMRKLYPSHSYDLVSNSSDKIEQDVINDICEVGFITSTPGNSSLYYQEVVKENVVFAARSDYPIADKIKISEIANYPLIILREECIIKENLEKELTDIGLNLDKLDIIFELESTEAMKSLVLKGYGTAFFPYNSAKKQLSAGELKIIEIEDLKLNYTIYLVSKHEKEGTVRDFIDGFKKLGNNICC